MTDNPVRRITPYPLGPMLPPAIAADRETATTMPAPAPELTDSQKIGKALGLLEIMADEIMAHRSRFDEMGLKLDALIVSTGGIRGATEDLRGRAEQVERRVKELEHHREGTDQRFELLGIEPPNGADHGNRS